MRDTGKLHLFIIGCLGDNSTRSFREDIRYSDAVWLNLPRMLAILGSVEQKLHERAVREGEGVSRRKLRRADGRQMNRAARPCDSFNQSLGCVPLGPELTTSDHATKPASQPYHTDSCQTLADVTVQVYLRLHLSFTELRF